MKLNKISRLLIPIVISFATASLSDVQARSRNHPLEEEAALNVLMETLKRDHVYDKRISLDCVTLTTDEITRIYFEFALHEKHNAKCGGDPETNPVVDRYRVNRASGKIELYDTSDDRWQPYTSPPSRRS